MTWLQLFIVGKLNDLGEPDEWLVDFKQEMGINVQVSAYKCIFDKETLNTEAKYAWPLTFMEDYQAAIRAMTQEQFSAYVGDNLVMERNFSELKYVLNNYIRMMRGQPPVIEFF